MITHQHFINGESVDGISGKFSDVYNPSLGEVSGQVPLADASEVDSAVAAAVAAFPAWSALNPQVRARVMFNFKDLLEQHKTELAELLSSEHGKVIDDAHGELQRGIDVVEFACGIPHLLKGEYSVGAGPEIDMYSMRQPLGVVAGITPFNFPGMIPMWMFPVATACGNTFVLKPAEKDPGVPHRLAELFVEAGAPAGVLNVINGVKTAVDAILDHPDIGAISFVGSSDIAQYVYGRGTGNGKRVQAMGGAKNHAIVMPDANLDQAAADIIGAAYGSAGERCMAISVAAAVGEGTADALIEKLLPQISALKVGASNDPDADYGPVVTAEHKQRICDYIALGVEEGAELVVDGRDLVLPDYDKGFFIGPTLFDNVTAGMRSYQDEIFGPVLQIVRCDTLNEGLELASQHQYGNGVAIFTGNGKAAREFAVRADIGMVGINVPIPVPLAYHSFGGWKRSAFGGFNQHGTEGVRFYTKLKTVTQRWPDGAAGTADFSLPVLK
ncbi:MAG: CoA-acylating methylmalonate-semialdehyde dehydrogenase [Arenicella sp.]|nr:CoA-acylating methylmalonate-semialdehyde dehydrogenase [Arenicella sp.]